ncbi:hypothetical protein V4V35_23800 [Bacillus infantis]|uniref:hypothetical protein n=1 Tax=Bacillus infantis TaxID=324767 RepID=UPI002FBD8136
MKTFSLLINQYNLPHQHALRIAQFIDTEKQAQEAAARYHEGWGMEIIMEMLITNIPLSKTRHYWTYRRKWNGEPARFILAMEQLGIMKS